MKLENENIVTPVYLKTEMDMTWPKDKMFYLLSSDGLYLCRNHEWFQSCALSKHGPGELEPQKPFVRLNYPKVPQTLLEKAVGFFRRVFKENHWESALILVWNRQTQAMELVCPDQKASGSSVDYEIPKLPQHLALIGDIHSHCDFSPKPSFTDEKDETYRPGLHIVAGYINSTPEFYCVAVVDGARFEVDKKDHHTVMEPYEDSDPKAAPQEWLDKVVAKYKGGGLMGGYYGGGDYYGGDFWQNRPVNPPDDNDQKVIDEILATYLKREKRPKVNEVENAMWRQTKVASLRWCENRAEEFMLEWDQAHGKVTTK